MPSTLSESARGEPPRSRPIAIQMPGSRRMRSQDPPSAPLSARGDLPGGYFPDHEDPETRVHRPHPFHADVREARRKSIARANEDSSSPHTATNSSDSDGLLPNGGLLSVPPLPPLPPATAPAAASAVVGENASAEDTDVLAASLGPVKPAVRGAYSYTVDHTAPSSIAAYNPTGAEDNLLPMGKYYPTNWENRKKAKRALKEKESLQKLGQGSESGTRVSRSRSPLGLSPATGSSPAFAAASSALASVKPENPSVTRAKEVPCPPALGGHSRSDSEVRRRIQQYQRDMITQATMAASRVLGSQIQQRGSEDVIKTLNTIPTLRNLQLSPPPGGARSHSPGRAGTVPSLSASASSISSASPASLGSGGLAAAIAASGHFAILSKPRSPRLQPLGSPGPVTPIDLCSNAEEVIGNAGGMLAIPRPRMPIGVATAPPAAGPRVPHHTRDSSFPFEANRP